MAVFQGLNVDRLFADIRNPSAALQSLNLDASDLGRLAGDESELSLSLTDLGISASEIQTISGLTSDQRIELAAISQATLRFSLLATSSIVDISKTLNTNLRIDNKLAAGTIKYNFYDYDQNSIRTADISTSRISSWSSEVPGDANSAIFYQGDLTVIPNSGTSNTSNITVDSLRIVGSPQPFRFVGADTPEIPTDLIQININGTNREFFAIKGIPLEFEAFFRNADQSNPDTTATSSSGLFYDVTDTAAQARWVITNVEDGNEFVSDSASFEFFDNTAKERLIQFYYDPSGILELGLAGLQINQLPNTNLPNLTYFNLNLNDFSELPDFSTITPALETLLISGNDMRRARYANNTPITANAQLQNLPSTLLNLEINATFNDDTDIDLSSVCPSLEKLTFSSSFEGAETVSVTNGDVAPTVNGSSITDYSVVGQRYNRLPSTVNDSTTLENLNINNTGINCAQDSVTPSANDDITLANATNLVSIDSRSSNHNLINVSGKAGITTYNHTNSSALRNGSNNDINDIFDSANVNLSRISLLFTGAYGSVTTAFQNLPALKFLDLGFTRNSGSLNDDSFNGTENITFFRVSGGLYNEADFFGAAGGGNTTGQVFANLPNLQHFYTYSNYNIQGTLPSFSENPALRVYYVRATGISGPVPLFSENINLYYLRVEYNSHTGNIPNFSSLALRYVWLGNNNLSGNIGNVQLDCPNLRFLLVQNNNLSGTITDFSGISKVTILRLAGNSITGYASGALTNNTAMNRLDLSRNSLSAIAASTLLNDLRDNYVLNPRRGVTVNLLQNSFTEGNLSTSALQSLSDLRNLGWTILI